MGCTKLIPQSSEVLYGNEKYPRICELAWGYTLEGFPEPKIILRSFVSTELVMHTLDGWKNLRDLIVMYYEMRKKNLKSFTEISLEPNLKGCIYMWKKNDKRALIIEIINNKNIRISLFPQAIKKLAHIVYDKINSEIEELFLSKLQIQEIYDELVSILKKNAPQDRNLLKFKENNINMKNGKIINALIESIDDIKRIEKIITIEDVLDLDECSMETFPSTPLKKRYFEQLSSDDEELLDLFITKKTKNE